LATQLIACGVTAPATHHDVGAACRAAQQAAGVGGRVLVFGSFHTVEQALRSRLLPAATDGATL
jgi:dihydrofolate synthase/folylpolyglutamate synthase